MEGGGRIRRRRRQRAGYKEPSLAFFSKLCPHNPFTADHKEHTAEDDGLSEKLAGCLAACANRACQQC